MAKRDGKVPFPVIVLTGITADEDTRRIERSGVFAILQKPVNVGLLFQALRDCPMSREPVAGSR